MHSSVSAQHSAPPIKDIIDALSKRCSWTQLRSRLKKDGLPIGLGWTELEANATGSSISAQKLSKFLREYFIQHILVGERYVQFYSSDATALQTVTNALQNSVVHASPFLSTYPLPLTAPALANAPTTPTLTQLVPFPNGDWAMIFCSTQSYDERTNQKIDLLSSVIQQIYSGYDELIAIKKISYQAYDVVYIRPSLERIEVCVDQPSKGSWDIDKRTLQILSTAASHLPSFSEIYQSSSENIFGAIGGIFFSPSEGVIRKLSFRTPTGSIKTERMVKDDLRREKFHYAGMEAVDNKISPYEVKVDYTFTYPVGSAEILLSASVRELSLDSPQLFGCYIDTDDLTSYLQAANKVIKFVN